MSYNSGYGMAQRNFQASNSRNRPQPLQTCFVCLAPDQLGVWEFCNEYKGIVDPGCVFLGCNAAGCCIQVRTISNRVNENTVRCETKTKDNVFVTLECAVQQQPVREKVREAIYGLMNPAQQIESYVADVVRSEVPKMTLDQVFENKDQIARAVNSKITKQMNKFGFNILQALVTNVEPSAVVKNALNNVEAAVKERVAQETKAKAAHFVAVKKAEAESESKALQGQGIAKQRMAIVDGLKESVGMQSSRPEDVAELLLVTQYFDTLEKISDSKTSTIFIPHSVGGVADVAAQIKRGILH